MSYKATRKIRQKLFSVVTRGFKRDSVMEEYRETGRVKITLRRSIRSWLTLKIMASGKTEHFMPIEGDEAELGLVSWTRTDSDTGEISGVVETVPALSKASIRLSNSGLTGEMQTKYVRLTDRFSLTLHCSRAESSKTGFALNGEDSRRQAFCWEWFLVEPTGHATKLQETGELELTFANPKDQIDIICCRFLTDVLLRVSLFDYPMPEPAAEPRYGLTIKAGSSIMWPVIVDGAVRMPNSKV